MVKRGIKNKPLKKVSKKSKKAVKKVSKKKIVKKKTIAKKKQFKKKATKRKVVKKKTIAKKKNIKKRVAKKISKRRPSKKRVTKNKPPKKNLKITPTPKRSRFVKNIIKESASIFRKAKIIKELPKSPTGIPGFDNMVNGGFESESINLIVGGSGSGKSIFAIQFLLEGIKKGETVLYVSFEEKRGEFFSNMKKFGWDLEKLENSNKLIFLEYSPEKVKMTLDEGGGTIETLILRHKISRMVIDSITSFSLLFDDPLSKKQANLGLFDIISKWNTTTLLTVQYDPSKGKGEDLPTIEFEADSISLLYFLKIKGKRQRFLEVLKMRGTNHSKETRAFEITKKGIIIGKTVNLKKEF